MLIVCLRDSASMAFKFASNDYNHLALQRIFDQPVLGRNRLSLGTLHKLRSQNHDVATIFNKDSVALHKIFVPQEKVVFVSMFNWTNNALVSALGTLNHLVQSQCISL